MPAPHLFVVSAPTPRLTRARTIGRHLSQVCNAGLYMVGSNNPDTTYADDGSVDIIFAQQ